MTSTNNTKELEDDSNIVNINLQKASSTQKLEEDISAKSNIKDPCQLKLLAKFYEKCQEILEDDTIIYNYRDKRACLKRALELIISYDDRIFGSYKIFGSVCPIFLQEPFAWKKIVDFLSQDIFFNFIGQYYLDEDTFLKHTINYRAKDKMFNYSLWGKPYKDIYCIIAARCNLPTLKKVEMKVELRDPMKVLIDNIRCRSGSLLEVTDPTTPDLSERRGVIRIDREKIINFDLLWEQAKIVYLKERLLSTDKFKLRYEQIISKVKKLKKHILSFGEILALPEKDDAIDDATLKKMTSLTKLLREENLFPIREDIAYKLSILTEKLADNLEEFAIQKIKRLDEHMAIPQTIYVDLQSKSNYHKFNGVIQGTRYPFVAAIGTLYMSDGSEKKNRYYVDPSVVDITKISWSKHPMSTMETKFINSGLGSLVFPQLDGTMLKLNSSDEDHAEEKK